MNEEGQALYEECMRSYLKARVSRAQLLKASIAGLAAAALPAVASADDNSIGPGVSSAFGGGALGLPSVPQVLGTYMPEDILTVLNITDTAEHLAVTVLTAAVGNAATLGLSGVVLQVVQAALAEEQYHADFLESLGARPLTDTFTVPDPKILSDYTTFFLTIEVAESAFVAHYATLVREFSELGQPTLAKYAYQIGSTEAEHRSLARAALALKGNAHGVPPENKAFETDLFVYGRDTAALLQQLGFIGGTGARAMYPGRAAALTAAGAMAGVIQQRPNNATTSVTAAANITGERPA